MVDWYDDGDEEQDSVVDEYEIVSSPNDFNITTIYNFITSGIVKIPAFQRNYVWDIKRASRLIESILMGLPIPQLFLYEQSRNEFLVIDGQQRLMSIYYFMEGRFPKIEKRIELRRIFAQKGRIPDETLNNDEYFEDFNLKLPSDVPTRHSKYDSLNYDTLGDYKTTFDLKTIRNIIIKQTAPEEDDSCIYEIFNRLNTGGVNLKPQEIRTSLYQSEFYDMLYQINLDPRWRKLLGVPEPDINMKDIEILLRGFSMLLDSDSYKPSMVRFLNLFSKRCKTLPKEKIDYFRKLFVSFLECGADLNKNAFFGRSERFNISVYESVFRAVCLHASKHKTLARKSIDITKLNRLKKNLEFIEATQSSTTSTSNVGIRLKLATDILNS